MWYWYLLGGVGFSIGLFSYSFLVVAGRADKRRDAIEREERLRSYSCGSAPGMESGIDDNSEQRALPSISLHPPVQSPLTNIKHSSP